MAKSSPDNMCRRALNNGKLVCKGKYLLTESQTWSRKLSLDDVTKGCLDKKINKDSNMEYKEEKT